MISCAAIQKLERYGQLGLKRRSVMDFIQSSLKDPKRVNIYALTHVPTWTECLSALTKQNDTDSISFSPGPLCVSDSLLYAVSFAVALVAHHVDQQRRHGVPAADAHISPIFSTSLSDAAALLELLQRVAENCAASAPRGPALLAARNHLLGTALDTLLVATVLRSAGDGSESDSTGRSGDDADDDDDAKASLRRQQLCRSATRLFVAIATQLRSAHAPPLTAAADSAAPTAFSARTCLAELRQLLSRARPAEAKATLPEHTHRKAPSDTNASHALVTARLVAWAAAEAGRARTLLNALAPLSAFQKISLIDALVAEAPASCRGVTLEQFRRSLARLVAPSAGNRATRVVVYFRSDEMKLMQNNVRDAAEYALYTHVTTPPLEDTILRGMAEMASPSQQQFGALLLAQWMSSITLFFRSFCAEESWTAFAQEQRRMVLRQETFARRERRQQKRLGISTSDSVSNCSDSNNNNKNNHDNRRGLNEHAEDQRSIVSQGSGLSLASRASMLSTMSKASAASYQSFISLIDAARGAENGNDRNEDTKAPALHQSADGNTNLPLILLEEMTLGLKRFLIAAENSDANTLIDNFSLRALAWRTIGDLYAFVQYTMNTRGNALSTDVDDPMHGKDNGAPTRGLRHSSCDGWASITPVFHLSHDIRYNRGMGYEVLGLLFANVVLPQLQSERSVSQLQPNRREIETALTRCLAAYEVIAPQVIDQNVPDILRVAAYVAMNPVVQLQQQQEQEAKDSQTHLLLTKRDAVSDGTTMLHRFLISLLTRLGKGNQIPMLLDAVVRLVKSASQPSAQAVKEHIRNSCKDKTKDDQEEEEEGEKEEEDQVSVAGLHAIFVHPRVRSALVEACSVSLDPEALTARLVAYFSQWTSDESPSDTFAPEPRAKTNEAGEDPCATRPSQLRPLEGLFVLDLVAAVLEGINPTCLTASALLEQAAEVELALSTFLVNKLYAQFFAGGNEAEEGVHALHGVRKGVTHVFAGGKVSSKLQRRFMLCTLHAIYQSRELVLSCLQDLGIQSVEVYLRMLEETLWQVESRVGALVGSLSIDDLHATLSLTTQQRYAPYVHRATLLPRLALQRMCLARSVGAALDISIGPKKEARRLAAFVLCHMYPGDEDGVYPSTEEGITRALELVNQLTEEQWHCLLQFGKHQRLRRTLVWLLRVSFNATSAHMTHATGWLPRCLRTCAGFLLEALYDIVLSVQDTEVLAAVQVSSPTAQRGARESMESTKAKESEEDERTPLVQLCAALSAALEYLGRIPQWPFLLQRCVHWLRLLQGHSKGVRHDMNEEEKGEATPLSLLERRLVQLTMTFLSCEEAVIGVLRRALLQQSTRQREKESRTITNGDTEKNVTGMSRRVAKSQSDHRRNEVDVNNAFIEAIGVPPIACVSLCNRDTAHVKGTQQEHEAKEGNKMDENEEDDDDGDVDEVNDDDEQHYKAKYTSDIFVQLATQIFSSDFAALLVRHCSASESENVAARVLQQLYNVALASAQRVSRYSMREISHEEHKENHCAVEFLHSVLVQLRRRCDAKDFSAVSAFLDAIGPSGTITFLTRHAHSNQKQQEQQQEQQQREERDVDGNQIVSSSQSRGDDLDQRDLPELSLQWVRLLSAMLPQVMRCISTEQCKATACVESVAVRKGKGQCVEMHTEEYKNIKDKDELLLRAFAALYILLERHSLSVPGTTRGKRRRESNEREIHNEKGDRNTMSLAFCGMKMLDGASLEYINQIFAPTDDSSRSSSAATIAYLISHSSVSLRTLWVLRSIYGFQADNNIKRDRQQHQHHYKNKNNSNHKNHSSDEEDWFDAILQCYDPNIHSTDTATATALASTASDFLLRRSSSYRPSLPNSAAATRWIIAQLQATPDLMRAFPSSVSLPRHMRRLLREAIALNHATDVSGTSDAMVWAQQRELLRASARALRELSTVPSLAFGSWRGDVKRLLVASGSSRLRTGSHSNTTSRNCDALLVDILELCALPLVTLHEDSGFIDHELAFLQGLCIGPELCGEKAMLRVLHLLTRTLLPLGVLWRRAHSMPGLLSALSARCLEGVARGEYSRVVLNQLSSFFFRFVRDAESGPAAAGVPAPVRSLCLASVTSCFFRLAAPMVNVFTTHSSDLDFVAADLLKALQRVHLPKRRALSAVQQHKTEGSNEKGNVSSMWSDATMCDLSFACVGDSDSQSLLRLAAERVEEEDGNAARHIFMVPQ